MLSTVPFLVLSSASFQSVEHSDGQLRQRDGGGLEDVAHAQPAPAHPQPHRARGTPELRTSPVRPRSFSSVDHVFTRPLCVNQQNLDNQSLDLSDDEELREQMDMHSIIVSSISDEPLFTAEQVGQGVSLHRNSF